MVTATIIPKKTPVPMAWRLAEPGPLAITIGSMPKLITLEETSRVSYVLPSLKWLVSVCCLFYVILNGYRKLSAMCGSYLYIIYV